MSVGELAERYCFSRDSIEALGRVLGLREVGRALSSLKSPGLRYFIRVNTLRASRDEVIARLREEGLEARPHPLVDEAVYLHVEGPRQVELLPNVVVADRKAAESVYMGADLYKAGVLRVHGRVRTGDLVTVVDPRGLPVAVGEAAVDYDEMVGGRGLAVKVLKSVYRVPSLRGLDVYEEGLVYDQSLPAILAVKNLAPQPGWLVVDLCSAPGGKATHAAQLMEGGGVVVAIDRAGPKIAKLRENVKRLGMKNVRIVEADSRYIDLAFPDLRADAVIVDPPCSSLGVRPKLYCDLTARGLASLASYQYQFLKVAARILKRGGRLLYSTCTMTLEENEANVARAVRELGMRLVEQRIVLGRPGLLGLGKGVQRFLPHAHDTPGFFIAALEKS